MLITMLGSIGLGLVWGWLMGSLSSRGRRLLRNGLALSTATFIFAIEVFLLAGWRAVALFLGAAASALLLHVLWRRELRRRFGPPNLQEGGYS
jgi:membrane protein implicated in regulation of membrane protease activity